MVKLLKILKKGKLYFLSVYIVVKTFFNRFDFWELFKMKLDEMHIGMTFLPMKWCHYDVTFRQRLLASRFAVRKIESDKTRKLETGACDHSTRGSWDEMRALSYKCFTCVCLYVVFHGLQFSLSLLLCIVVQYTQHTSSSLCLVVCPFPFFASTSSSFGGSSGAKLRNSEIL